MADKKPKQRGLGRGLSALMSDVTDSASGDQSAVQPDLLVPIERVKPNPDQPRRHFDQTRLDDLAASIKEKGIIQPLIVRPRPGVEGEYEIVAGERRWRAAQQAQLHRIPVLVREMNDTEVLEVAIIENIQRADLDPVEEAAGYTQLMEKFGHTQEKLAAALGKSRSHIANTMRLLQLPDSVQKLLSEGKLSAGHARALITAENPHELALQIVKKDLSVRATEKLVKAAGEGKLTRKPIKGGAASEKDADTRALEADLSANLRMKVVINHKSGAESGEVSISYASLDELDNICRILSATS